MSRLHSVNHKRVRISIASEQPSNSGILSRILTVSKSSFLKQQDINRRDKQKKEEADQAFKAGDIQKGMKLLHVNACWVLELWIAHN